MDEVREPSHQNLTTVRCKIYLVFLLEHPQALHLGLSEPLRVVEHFHQALERSETKVEE